MGLKALLRRKNAENLKAQLEELKKKDEEFAKREAELESAVEELTEETPEEDRKIVEEEVDTFNQEKEEHEEKKKELEDAIADIENEIKEDEERSAKRAERVANQIKVKNNEEREVVNMPTHKRFKIFGETVQERNAFFENEHIKAFLNEVRSAIKEKRALTNIGLTIPDVMLPMIRQKTEEYSKLMSRVTVRYVRGTSRQNIMGEIPEGYWDEMCASIKELSLAFNNIELDGYKVSGYFAVCNATLEDSDLDLAYELLDAIGRALGKALDKAILYGTDAKMPMGIVTSLLKTSAPDNYPDTGRTWDNLSTSNIVSGKSGASGVALFQDIVNATSVIDNDYETGELTFVMNKKTHVKLLSESMGTNSAASVVAGMGNTMPVVGGSIIEFNYIPDNTIIFGYFKNYLLVERAGLQLRASEEYKFIEDQTVFRGTARYDGDLVIREAFAVYGIGGAPTTTAPSFAGE